MNSVVLKPNKIDFTGDAIYLGYGLKEDYIGNDVSGKTIIIKSGGPNVTDTRAAFGMTEQKEELAEEHGAIAIIELLDTNDRIWGFIEHQSNGERIEIADENEAPKNITYLWIMDENNLYAKALESKKNHTVKLKMEGEVKTPILSHNVIGMVEGTDPKLKTNLLSIPHITIT